MTKEISNIICAATTGAAIVLAVLVYGLFNRYEMATMGDHRSPIVVDHLTGKCFGYHATQGTKVYVSPQ